MSDALYYDCIHGNDPTTCETCWTEDPGPGEDDDAKRGMSRPGVPPGAPGAAKEEA